MVITVNSLGTVDELDGTVLCDGCADPVSLALSRVYFAADGVLRSFDPSGNTMRNCVHWMGGAPSCYTPSKNVTLGQVKALYR